jgi:hypothetical protein
LRKLSLLVTGKALSALKRQQRIPADVRHKAKTDQTVDIAR